MNKSQVLIGLTIINCISLILTLVYLRNTKVNESVATILDYCIVIACFIGGEIGVLLALMIRKRKVNKSTITPYSFGLIAFIFHCFIFYLLFASKSQLSRISNFIFKYQSYWLIYCIVINAFTFISFGYDKYAAIKNYHRLPNALLLLESFCFGSLGALMAMGCFRHKTKKIYFTLTIPLMLMMQLMMVGLLVIR